MTRESPDNEYLSGRDNAWLRMGDRTNHMIITAVLFFDEPVSYEELENKLEERLLPFKRFRQRVVTPWHRLRPKWEIDPLFNIDTHLTHAALPEPQGKEELQRFVAETMDKDLDRSRALWHGWLVDGAGEGDGNALVVRIHHALGDGFALLYVLLGLADDPASIDMPLGEVPPPPGISDEEWRKMSVDAPEPDDTEDGDGLDETLYGSDGVEEKREEKEEEKKGSSIGEKVRMGANMAKIGFDSLTLSKEPKTSLRGDLELTERVSWTETFETERVKQVGHAYDGTINDVLMAATAGGFRRYLVDNGEDVPDDLDLRCAVPVNLKPLQERTEELGNYFGLGFLELPVGVEDPQERMEMIQDRTGKLKQGTEAYLMYLALSLVGALPSFVQYLVMKRFHNRMTAAVTNVPGPKESIEFAGKEVSDIKFWVPRSEDIGVGISIFSYNGGVSVGVAADESLVPEPARLADAFNREMEAILQTVETEGEVDVDEGREGAEAEKEPKEEEATTETTGDD
ncbi:MAG: wax ester/triacylglycerol synthase family O-acyltransferase [Halobacteriales archaeon]|nr:wax ester/triacylglycerol synthase family O-acyltransferase [Halobacteriales archaeon]